MKLDTIDYNQSEKWIPKDAKEALIELIGTSFKGIDAEQYFYKYFDDKGAFARKLRLYFYQNEIVGYCLITFTRCEKDTLIGASAAFYPKHRKGGNTFIFSMKQSFLYWLKHPLQNTYYADTMLSPAMYRAIANKAAIVWPNETSPMQRRSLFERLNAKGNISPLINLRCLVDVGRSSNYTELEVGSFKTSQKSEILFYCNVNPEFDKGSALFVIIPISFKQLILTAVKTSFSSIKSIQIK